MNTSKPHFRFLIIAILLLATGFASCSPQAKKARQLERAERSFKAGEYDKAKIDYLAVLRVEPQNATAIQRLGLIWSESGSALTALPFLMKTRELNPGDLVARKKLANALVSLGDWGGAKKEAIEILRQAPSDGEILLTLAETARTPEQLPELEQRSRQASRSAKMTRQLPRPNCSRLSRPIRSRRSPTARLAISPWREKTSPRPARNSRLRLTCPQFAPAPA
jgi:tetratricopeptide (TPR) repeat protein